MKDIVVRIERCVACKTCELRCAIERSSVSRNLIESLYEEIRAMPRVRVNAYSNGSIPLQCRHCVDAPCIDACSVSALKRDEKTDTVYIDETRCIGCWMCIMVCPFGVVSPSYDRRVAIKCDRCFQMEAPYCVTACPTKALMFVDTKELREISYSRQEGIVKRVLVSLEQEEKNVLDEAVDLDYILKSGEN